MPIRLGVLTWLGLLFRPRRTLTLVRPSDAGLKDLFVVALLAGLTQFAVHLAHPILDGMRRAVGAVPGPTQVQVDLWDHFFRHAWWAAAAVITLIPALDVVGVRLLGARGATFRQVVRVNVLALAPLGLLLPLQCISVLLWVLFARVDVNSSFRGPAVIAGLVLGIFGVLLPAWALWLKVRLLRAVYSPGPLRSTSGSVAAPKTTGS
jgi:hypothetical protein